jgi:hypothetical protein
MRIAVLGPLNVVNDDHEQVGIAGSKERLLLADPCGGGARRR